MCEYCKGTGVELDVVALDTGDANYPNVSINLRGELQIITDSREYAEADRVLGHAVPGSDGA